jgi:hypothetical protein
MTPAISRELDALRTRFEFHAGLPREAVSRPENA